MIAYFVRRVVGGAVKLLLLSLALYIGVAEVVQNDPSICCCTNSLKPCNGRLLVALISTYKLDNPRPLGYLLWLFDPSDTTQLAPNKLEYIPKGIDWHLGTLRVRGSGILTGDLGRSVRIEIDAPVVEIFGGLGQMFAVLSIVMIALMAVAVLQRLGRPRVLSGPFRGAQVGWRYSTGFGLAG
jgi:hypothetical protein